MIETESQKLIYRYFRGQLSDDEYELLTDLLQEADNREYFDQVTMMQQIGIEVGHEHA